MKKTRRQQLYSADQDFHLIIPYQFLLLCRLLDAPPQHVLYEFMCNAGFEHYSSGQEQKAKAMEYFISCGYGQKFLVEDEIRLLFKELDSIACLWPTATHKKFISSHRNWRNKYYLFFYTKWYRKLRRCQ
jgi:hypothetical protein